MKDLFKKFIDEEFDNWLAKQQVDDLQKPEETETPEEEKPKREDGKRAVRAKGTGDRVYLLDPEAKTKAWITSEEVLNKLGWQMGDVENVEDSEMIEYQSAPSIFQVNE